MTDSTMEELRLAAVKKAKESGSLEDIERAASVCKIAANASLVPIL